MERTGAPSLTLEADGAQLFPNLINGESLGTLEEILSDRPREAGVRIFGDPKLSKWIACTGAISQLARSLLGPAARPVRAILFDKNREANWALDWHQDRTIAVRARIETEGFRNWTVKSGTPHAEPPYAVLERMITARIHLDDVGDNNGPLLIAPGSHRLGRLEESEIAAAVTERGATACLASAGGVWVYKTAIVHSSKASRDPKTRRVLHIDFAAEDLPGSLEWAGIG